MQTFDAGMRPIEHAANQVNAGIEVGVKGGLYGADQGARMTFGDEQVDLAYLKAALMAQSYMENTTPGQRELIITGLEVGSLLVPVAGTAGRTAANTGGKAVLL